MTKGFGGTMLDAQTLTFAGVVALLTITPGADTMLVMRSVFARGRVAGLLTTLGVCSGLFVHAAFSALGLSVILMRSAAAFEAVKLVGAAYLIFLGVQSLWRVWRSRGDEVGSSYENCSHERGHVKAFYEGLLTNVLNPKVAVFYLAFLPQFIQPSDPVLIKSLLLAGIHFSLGMVWLSLVTVFLGQMRAVFVGSGVQRGLEAVAGVVLVGLGVRLALERR